MVQINELQEEYNVSYAHAEQMLQYMIDVDASADAAHEKIVRQESNTRKSSCGSKATEDKQEQMPVDQRQQR